MGDAAGSGEAAAGCAPPACCSTAAATALRNFSSLGAFSAVSCVVARACSIDCDTFLILSMSAMPSFVTSASSFSLSFCMCLAYDFIMEDACFNLALVAISDAAAPPPGILPAIAEPAEDKAPEAFAFSWSSTPSSISSFSITILISSLIICINSFSVIFIANFPYSSVLLAVASTYLSKYLCSYFIPSSPMIMLRMYDVPEDNHPKRRKLIIVTSKLNSSVNGESSIKNHPT